MGGNPVETKVEVPNVTNVLAAAAGVPTPPKKGGLWAKAWHYRKLALILGGSGITLGGGGYGYKYFTATPGKANAEVAAVASKPEEPKNLPSFFKDETSSALPAVTPVKNETPAVPDIKMPDLSVPEIKIPAIKPSTPETDVPIVLPPMSGSDTKKPEKSDDPPILIAPPEVKLPASDKKAAGDGDTFKATDPLTTDKTKVALPTGPAPLPSDVTERKEKPVTGPVIRIGGTEPMPPAPPAPPAVDVPTIPVPGAPAVKKEEPAGTPKIPMIDIDVPPIAAPETKKAVAGLPPLPPISVPGPTKDDTPVIVPVPGKVPEAKTTDVPTISIPQGPINDPPIAPPKTPIATDPPGIPTITIPDSTSPPIGVPTPPVKKDNYEEDWHTWKTGDTFTLISQEFLHDAKYAAALEAYNKDRGKGSDRIIRVPPPYVLEEQFPHLINKAEKTDKPEPTSPPEGKTNNGLRFEPAAPIPSAGRSAPTPAIPTAAPPRDQYRVTAESGETIREVARKTLGDSNLWWKLGELNPSIDPSRPIPVGTALKLPK